MLPCGEVIMIGSGLMKGGEAPHSAHLTLRRCKAGIHVEAQMKAHSEQRIELRYQGGTV